MKTAESFDAYMDRQFPGPRGHVIYPPLMDRVKTPYEWSMAVFGTIPQPKPWYQGPRYRQEVA